MRKLTEKLIYLDNSATTFMKPEAVYNKIISVMKTAGGNAGRGGHLLANRASDVIFDTRILVSELFNIPSPEEICFVNNASTGLNFAIKGVLNNNDHVIISPYEHNSVVRPIYKLTQKGVKCSVAQENENGYFEDLESVITPETKMIIINHVSNVNGRIADIEKIGEIAKKGNIVFAVDASQSAGHIDIDVQKNNIDILVCSGHKGLFGPQGTGVMYVKKGLELDTLFEGGSGSSSELLIQPEILPDRFETGTQNAPAIGALGEGIKFIKDVGVGNIEKYENMLAETMIDGLNSMKNICVYSKNEGIKATGVVGFNIIGKDSVEIANLLSGKYNVAVRGGLHCAMLAHKTIGTLKTGCLRASLSCFNTKKQVEKFLNIIDTVRHFDVY